MTDRPRAAAPSAPIAIALVWTFACATASLLGQVTQPAASTGPSITTQPAPYKPTLMAHGTPNRLWIAYVETTREGSKTQYKTHVRSQVLPADQWQELPTVHGHGVALANLQSELALLQDDGNWKRIGDTVASGPAITAATGPVLGWASSPQGLYAIRAADGGMAGLGARGSDTGTRSAGATQPATRPASEGNASGNASTRALTANPQAGKTPVIPPTPVLFQFERGQWKAIADLPPAGRGRDLALTVLNNRPVVAIETAPDTLATWQWVDGAWADWGQMKAAPGTGRFALLATATSAGLWTIDQDGGMQLFLRTENEPWSQAKAFAPPKGIPMNAQRALTVAGEELRLVALKDAKLMEQRYDLSGNPRGGLADLPVPRPQQPTQLLWILQTVVLLIMILVMIVTFYRRRAAQPQQQQERQDDREE